VTLRWGLLSTAAINGALLGSGHGEFVAVASRSAERAEAYAREHEIPVAHASYEALLDRAGDFDAVFCFADNRLSAELGARAAALGKHVMLEKPMASSLAIADRLYAAARRHGVHLMVNYPHNWNAKLREAYRLTKAGAVGEVFKLRYAGGHAGPREIGCSGIFCDWLYDAERNGAGALVDQGGYAATVCRWFLGRPGRVVAMGGRLTKTADVDVDNVVILCRYPQAIGVAETSWSWVGGLPTAGPVVYGTDGTLVAHGARETAGVTVVRKGGREPTVVEAPPLPEGERNAPEYFLRCIVDDRPVEGLVSPQVCRDAQEILEAAAWSIRTGAEVPFPLDRALAGIG
jgi:predicted dehydrogenase